MNEGEKKWLRKVPIWAKGNPMSTQKVKLSKHALIQVMWIVYSYYIIYDICTQRLSCVRMQARKQGSASCATYTAPGFACVRRRIWLKDGVG